MEFDYIWEGARNLTSSDFLDADMTHDWLRLIYFSSATTKTEFDITLQGASTQCPLPSLCFSDLASDRLIHFRILLCNRSMDLAKLDRKQVLNFLYHFCFFNWSVYKDGLRGLWFVQDIFHLSTAIVEKIINVL